MIFGNPSSYILRVLIALVFCGLISNIAWADDPDPRALLKRMSDELASLQNFIIKGDAYAEYEPVYQGTTVIYVVNQVDAGANTDVEFDEYQA